MRPSIIGVFGSDETDTLAISEAIGAALAERGAVTLTGGRGPDGDAVKEYALRGAERAAGAWIGVHREDGGERDPEVTPRTLVLRPGGDHRRNVLEAHLVDAAIAVPGGPGTASEAVFCMARGRPVVLLGEEWLPLSASDLLAAARTRVLAGEPRPDPIDTLVDGAYADFAALEIATRVVYWPSASTADAATITGLALDLAQDAGRRAAFPTLPSRPRTAAAYGSWRDDR